MLLSEHPGHSKDCSGMCKEPGSQPTTAGSFQDPLDLKQDPLEELREERSRTMGLDLSETSVGEQSPLRDAQASESLLPLVVECLVQTIRRRERSACLMMSIELASFQESSAGQQSFG